jgi:F420-0:gamma-glutamyl ligase
LRITGTKVFGIRAPIIKEGDDLIEIVISSVKTFMENEKYEFEERDVLAITESLVARAQGNYVSLDDIAIELREKYPGEIGIVFPILSRNRFSMILKGIVRSKRKIYIQLNYPTDEVGNALMDINRMNELNINPYSDILSEEEYLKSFGDFKHPFTGINYVQYYKEIARETENEIIFSNKAETILNYTEDVLVADIHTRFRTKKALKEGGANIVYGLDELCNIDRGKGFNPEYGLLGSNKSSEERLKLFPREGNEFVTRLQERLREITGKTIEVMIYGDGAFKDPAAKIWELADPVVSPAYTSGLEGIPNELKLKYLADNELKDLEGEKLLEEMKKEIRNKESNLIGKIKAQGTTPRQLTDLLGSLCDLVSGSGDKGTPIVLVKGYFDNLGSD